MEIMQIKELESENKMLREKVMNLERQVATKGVNEDNPGMTNASGPNTHSNTSPAVENHKN